MLKIKRKRESYPCDPSASVAFLSSRPFTPNRPTTPNYEDDVRPIFQRRCFGCHNASEMRAGLSLESYSGVMKGGGSGDIVIAGRPASSLLFKAVSHESGAPQMPLGQAKLPDAEIAVIRDWIQLGLPETSASVPEESPPGPNPLDFTPSTPEQTRDAAMPESLPPWRFAKRCARILSPPWPPVPGRRCWPCPDMSASTSTISTSARLLGELPSPKASPTASLQPRWRDAARRRRQGVCRSGKVALFDVRTGNRLATSATKWTSCSPLTSAPTANWSLWAALARW